MVRGTKQTDIPKRARSPAARIEIDKHIVNKHKCASDTMGRVWLGSALIQLALCFANLVFSRIRCTFNVTFMQQ